MNAGNPSHSRNAVTFGVKMTLWVVRRTGFTPIALMIPYTVFVLVAWIILFIVWFALGIPLGPGYPVTMP